MVRSVTPKKATDVLSQISGRQSDKAHSIWPPLRPQSLLVLGYVLGHESIWPHLCDNCYVFVPCRKHRPYVQSAKHTINLSVQIRMECYPESSLDVYSWKGNEYNLESAMMQDWPTESPKGNIAVVFGEQVSSFFRDVCGCKKDMLDRFRAQQGLCVAVIERVPFHGKNFEFGQLNDIG